jgi:hypothetical protein
MEEGGVQRSVPCTIHRLVDMGFDYRAESWVVDGLSAPYGNLTSDD